MKPTLVTGATGFLGWHVARKLLAAGATIRVLARDPARVRDLEGVEIRVGDLRDAGSLERAVAGCGVVYHVAADYRLWVADAQPMYETNVNGTRNLLTAARKAGVDRVVYTSTVGCIGIPNDGLGDERTPVSLRDMVGPYKRSKFLAERVALEFAAQGFPVVVVNPTAPVGDHDFKPTPTGRIITEYLRGAMPAYLDTGLNLVDAADVAAGHLLACEQGKPGERYILGGRNMTLREIFQVLERLSGVPAPQRRIPYWVAYGAGLVSTLRARITGRTPRAPLDAVRMARKKMFVSTEKAARELGYTPAPVEGALERAIEWFRAHGYIGAKGGGRGAGTLSEN